MFGSLLTQFQYNVLRTFKRSMPFYAVAKGRKVGIYATWSECEEQVKGFKGGAVFKKFKSHEEAVEFIDSVGGRRSKYKPEEIAVPLGKKELPQQQSISKDFWPEDVAGEGDTVTEGDLLAAINEVEGFQSQSSSSLKRKFNDYNTNSKIPRHNSNVQEVVALKQIGAFEFTMDAEGYVIVYTDGSCIGNGRADACAGLGVYFGDNHPLNAAKPVHGRVTNNVGEIQAAIYAIKISMNLGISKLSINTDSQFLINSITLWVEGWKKRGWLLQNNKPVKNMVDFKELDKLLQNEDIKVKWNYVAAHQGIEGNEMADKLAREGAKLYKELNSK